MRILSKLSIFTAGLVVIGLSGIAVVTAAPNAHADNSSTSTTTETTDTGGSSSKGKTKLSEIKLKVCKKRETSVNNILTRISDRGQKQLDLFSSIATKTEAFYASKGKAISNYDALVADVNAKKAAAQTEVDSIKSNSVTFKCDGTDPKGAVSGFKTVLKAEISALKDFKTAVKNLIVGVKSAQGETSSTDKTSKGGEQ